MVENSFAGMPDALADILAQRGLADHETRARALRRAGASVAVVLLHVVMVLILVVSQKIPVVHHVFQPVETIIFLRPAEAPANMPPPKKIIAVPVPENVPEIRVQPITPPVPVPNPQTTETNVLRALGMAIACGASHYEYLSPAERKLCRHPPWKMPPDKNLAIAPPPPPPIGQLTGAEGEALLRQTSRPCPILQNTPCIEKELNGTALPH